MLWLLHLICPGLHDYQARVVAFRFGRDRPLDPIKQRVCRCGDVRPL